MMMINILEYEFADLLVENNLVENDLMKNLENIIYTVNGIL